MILKCRFKWVCIKDCNIFRRWKKLPRTGSAFFELFTDTLSSLLSLLSAHWYKIFLESMCKRVMQKDSTVKSQLLLETYSEEHAESTQGLIGQKRATPKFHTMKACSATVWQSVLHHCSCSGRNVYCSGTTGRLMHIDFSLCREISLLFKQGYHCADRGVRVPLTCGFF